MRHYRIVALTALFAVLIWSLIVQYNAGTRLSPLLAAKAHFSVGGSAEVFDQLDFPWGKVYLMDTPDGERTVVVRKRGFFWESPFAATLVRDSKADTEPVRTVGLLNVSYVGVTPPWSVALIAVTVKDPAVVYIEAGIGSDRIQKGVETSGYVMLSWPKIFPEADLKPVAFSSDGTPLYEYRYAQENVTDPKTLKWYPVW